MSERKAKITTEGEMPSMNKIVDASKNHWGGYSNMKAENTGKVRDAAQDQTAQWEGKFDKDVPNVVFCKWYRKNKRTDPDNISAGIKFVLDGLVEAGVMDNDGWGQIAFLLHAFEVDKENPRVETHIGQGKVVTIYLDTHEVVISDE